MVGVRKDNGVTNGNSDEGDRIAPNNSADTMHEKENEDVPTGSSSQERPSPFPTSNDTSDTGTNWDETDRSPAKKAPSTAPEQNDYIRRVKRAIKHFASHWPRTVSILQKALILWTLICWSLALGYALAALEGPQEVISNNAIVMESFLLSNLPIQQTKQALLALPISCLSKFVDVHSQSGIDLGLLASSNATLNFNKTNGTSDSLSFPVEDFLAEHYPNYSLPNVTLNDPPSLDDLYEYMEDCEATASDLLNVLVKNWAQVTANAAEATDPLTFNWIRCWNASDPELGRDRSPWIPNQAQINASANQSEFFRLVWRLSQEALQLQYEQEWNCNGDKLNETTCMLNAREASIQDATGGDGCGSNTGASAWFWFTVMTSRSNAILVLVFDCCGN